MSRALVCMALLALGCGQKTPGQVSEDRVVAPTPPEEAPVTEETSEVTEETSEVAEETSEVTEETSEVTEETSEVAEETSEVTEVNKADHAMVLVPEGLFVMGWDAGDPDEQPPHQVFLSAYYIDQFEVTIGLYRRCVEDDACEEPAYAPNCNWDKEIEDTHPINCVNRQSAFDYCAWAGLRLPTEAEWEKAARGTDGRIYPWGYELEGDEANFRFIAGATEPVGSRPTGVSPYGAHDMAGNVWEWVSDWYGDTYYAESPRDNPQGPLRGEFGVLRGGSWWFEKESLPAANREAYDPRLTDIDIGIRCARDF